MCISTLSFAPTKTYNPISIDHREKRREEKKIFFSLSILAIPSVRSSPPFCFFISFDFIFFFILFFFFQFSIYPSLIRVCLCPETIYLFSVQFILNELSSSHFLTFEIFIKISSLESLATSHPELVKNSDCLIIR